MKAKILIVDDEPDALEVLAFKLRVAGFTPILARDGARALAAARDERPDLVVLDLMLPEVDGLEVCKILRRDPATASVPANSAAAAATSATGRARSLPASSDKCTPSGVIALPKLCMTPRASSANPA